MLSGTARAFVLSLCSLLASLWANREERLQAWQTTTLDLIRGRVPAEWIATPPPAEIAPASPPVNLLDLPDPSPWPRLNPEANLQRAWLLAEGPARSVNVARRLVAFTFDDGPSPDTTPVLLRLLHRHRIQATFFLIGRYLEGDSDRAQATRRVAQQIVAAGHTIGNHTEDHLSLTQISHAQAIAQIDDGARAIEKAVGRRPVFFRPPYGALDAWTERAVQARGLDLVLWSVEVADMQHSDVDEMARSLACQLDYAGGGIVLLHDVRATTIQALGKLLEWIELRRFDPSRPLERGYELVTLEDYIHETASKPQPYASRLELSDARSLEAQKYRRLAGGRRARVRL